MKFSGLSKLFQWSCIASLTLLAACSSLDVSSNAPALAKTDQLAVLPIVNYTETPDAGQRAQSIAQSLLHQKGLAVQRYPNDDGADFLIGGAGHNQAQALDWARTTGAQYALGGSVQEWRYKVGVDGEPVASLTFNLIDLKSGAIVWSATGSRSGWSRSSVAGVGQTLIRQLLSPLTPR